MMAMAMRRNLSGLRATIRRVRHGERGVSLIEFALIFPVLVALFLGLVEFGEAFSVSRKVTYSAAAVSDLVSQAQSVTNAELADIALVANELIKPYRTDRFGMVITSVVADKNDPPVVHTVAWSYATGTGATARATGSTITVAHGLTEPGSSLILVETYYQFTPSVGLFLLGTHNLDGHALFRPRLTKVIAKTD